MTIFAGTLDRSGHAPFQAMIAGDPGNGSAGDGLGWSGSLALPVDVVPPPIGETLQLLLSDNRRMDLVVTEVDGSVVHFTATGKMPVL
jgi:hypothetical protein